MMYPISAALAAALAGPGPDKVRVWGEVWSLTDGTKTGTVEIESGNITLDGSAAIRRSCQLRLPSLDGLTPEIEWTGQDRNYGDHNYGTGIYGNYRRRFYRGALLPLMAQVRIFWSALLPGTDTWETVPLGRFTVSDPTFSDTAQGQALTLSGFDAAADVAAAAWTSAYVIPRGTNVATALRNLLQSRVPGLVVNTPTTTHTTPQLVYTPGGMQGGDPWQHATELAASAGWILYIDRNGAARAEVPPDPSTGDPVWDLLDDGTAQSFEQTPSGANLVNTVVVFAESSGDKPVYAVVQDMNGPYGVNIIGRVISKEYRSSTVRTLAQAQNVGISLLRAWGTLSETVQIRSAPAPHLEPGDLISIFSSVLELEDPVYGCDRVVFDLDPRTPTVVTVARRL